jgi:hypothetical protein
MCACLCGYEVGGNFERKKGKKKKTKKEKRMKERKQK